MTAPSSGESRANLSRAPPSIRPAGRHGLSHQWRLGILSKGIDLRAFRKALGTLKKKLGLTLASAKEERGRVYRIADPANL